mgnify:CR=1 FL=1
MRNIVLCIITLILFVLSIFWYRKRKSRIAYVCYFITQAGVILSFAAAAGASDETIEFLVGCITMGAGWIFVRKYILKN